MKRKDYDKLDRHFTAPKVISPFFGEITRIPRKLKKRLSKYPEWNYNFLTIGQKLWHDLTVTNPDYARFIIKKICES
jgi:hypothetical protein